MWQCRQGWLVLQFPSLGALCWLLGEREPHQGPGLPGHPPRGWKIKLCPVGLCEEGAGRPQGRRGRLKGEGRMQGPRRPHWKLDQAPLNTPSLYPVFSAPRAYGNGFPLKPSLFPTLPCSTGTPPSQPQNYSSKAARAFFPHSAPKPARIEPCCRTPTVPSNIQNRQTLSTGQSGHRVWSCPLPASFPANSQTTRNGSALSTQSPTGPSRLDHGTM